jgi:hypothetical protein
MAIVKAVGVNNPPRNVTVLDETLGGLGGLYPLLDMRALAGCTTSSE